MGKVVFHLCSYGWWEDFRECGFRRDVRISLARNSCHLLLSVKAHFHIYLAIAAAKMNLLTMSTGIVMVIVVYLTFIHAPLVVQNIIKRARKRSPTQQMALQWLNSSNELRLILCLHGPQNTQSAINFMELSRGPPDPGMMVYLTDMIELTDKIAATLARGEGVEAMTVTDKGVIEMREKIGNAVNGTWKTIVKGSAFAECLRSRQSVVCIKIYAL